MSKNCSGRSAHPYLKDPGLVDLSSDIGCFESTLLEWLGLAIDVLMDFSSKQGYFDEIGTPQFLLLEGDQLNARVIPGTKSETIVIYCGTWRTIWVAIVYLLDNSVFLNEVMSSRLKITDTPRSFNLEQRIQKPLAPPSSWDPSRLDYARALFLRSMEYVVAHEIAHVVRYHLDLLNREFGLSFIDEQEAAEVVAEALSSDRRRLQRNIEFDADFHGIDLMIASWVERRKNDVASGRQEPIDTDVATSELFVHVLGIVLVHLLLDRKHREIRVPVVGEYPASVHRAMRSALLCERTFRDEFGLDAEESMRFHDEAWGEASLVASGLGFPEGRWHGETMEGMAEELYEKLLHEAVTFSRWIDEYSP